jgi:hypothetical protein
VNYCQFVVKLLLCCELCRELLKLCWNDRGIHVPINRDFTELVKFKEMRSFNDM